VGLRRQPQRRRVDPLLGELLADRRDQGGPLPLQAGAPIGQVDLIRLKATGLVVESGQRGGVRVMRPAARSAADLGVRDATTDRTWIRVHN
jgi:hypothetical protein